MSECSTSSGISYSGTPCERRVVAIWQPPFRSEHENGRASERAKAISPSYPSFLPPSFDIWHLTTRIASVVIVMQDRRARARRRDGRCRRREQDLAAAGAAGKALRVRTSTSLARPSPSFTFLLLCVWGLSPPLFSPPQWSHVMSCRGPPRHAPFKGLFKASICPSPPSVRHSGHLAIWVRARA